MLSYGVDIINVGRIEEDIQRFGDRFLDRIYTEHERSLCDCGQGQVRFQRYAGYWAVKEAAMKALGTGYRRGVAYKDIETRHEESADQYGKPYLVLYGIAMETAKKIGVKSMAVSISHEREFSIASVIFEKKD
ncbi:holo-ACP synthase [Candidatus Pacearchaeota archaeon]|nr:holo-ACP synthase [Candidatus Pacearchaeota archaeon]